MPRGIWRRVVWKKLTDVAAEHFSPSSTLQIFKKLDSVPSKRGAIVDHGGQKPQSSPGLYNFLHGRPCWMFVFHLSLWPGQDTHPAICRLGMLVVNSFVVRAKRWTMYKNAPWWPGLPLELLRYKTYFLPFPSPADLSRQLPQAILLPRTLALPPRHMHTVYRLPRHDQHLGEPSGRGAG